MLAEVAASLTGWLGGPFGRMGPNRFGALSCLTMTTLGLARMSILAPEWGVQRVSPSVCTESTAWAKDTATTKKSYTLPLQVAAAGTLMTPPMSLSHPAAASSAGVQFQSLPMHHGPLLHLRTPAMPCSRSRLHLAPMPTLE